MHLAAALSGIRGIRVKDGMRMMQRGHARPPPPPLRVTVWHYPVGLAAFLTVSIVWALHALRVASAVPGPAA